VVNALVAGVGASDYKAFAFIRRCATIVLVHVDVTS
jgi:hypothetical protein